MPKPQVQEAINLIRVGRKAEARELLLGVLRADRDDAVAWVAMSQAARDEREAIRSLKEVLRLKPGDPWATRRLSRLGAEPPPAAAPPPRHVETPPPPIRRPAKAKREREPDLPVSKGTPSWVWIVGSLAAFVVLVLIGVAVWNEFFAQNPEEEQAILLAAQQWTYAEYAMDYDRMTALACRSHQADIQQAYTTGRLLGSAFGVDISELDLGTKPPANLRYEVQSASRSSARVRITGFAAEYREIQEELGIKLPGYNLSDLDTQIYSMRREGDQWKWCGTE